ncbi:hypothetical protein CH276_14180 [Rhodococcus sp. 06-470-2]|uniref:hypothetical protein n=1 Tax=unclassified Rhodococcus (in: high G+C Gram-positive bacteria) TaxID=192944 RepID=UPI000B9A47ED|nr:MULTISPECIES: hypothetical protein [unclassified Rhodococcus (in: high G+C Gram-positive bacteria)]OZC62763.1 hypothetical protein CH276_14180 [Rhodococcus sp. 06-470-2]OZE71740.1 hypothetical protein CH265_01660 [Rhodococcus sp. 05-2221-1B]
MDSLDDGGQELLEELAVDGDSYEMTALITEVCRIKDRLDRLHRVLTGDDDLWMRLIPSRGDAEVLEIRIDSAAQESRQLATVFRQMLAEVKRRRAENGDAADYDPLDDL